MKIHGPQTDGAFTRLDLLFLIGCFCLLMALQATALGHGASKSRTTGCLSNLRRLSLAWVLFANDHNGRMPGMFQASLATSPQANDPRGPWCVGFLDWTTSTQNTNTLFLTDSKYSSIAVYQTLIAADFRCPADDYITRSQSRLGWRSRSRSYSGSAAVGDGNAEVNLWDGLYYRHVLRTSELLTPGPASTFVFTEEHPDSINDPSLVLPLTNRWVDLPGSFHDGAANFTFADGHAEMHKWTDTTTTGKVRYSRYYGSALTNLDDLSWVRTHAPRQTE